MTHSSLLQIANFEFHWDWPEWLNLQVLWDFIKDPWEMIDEAILHVIEMLTVRSQRLKPHIRVIHHHDTPRHSSSILTCCVCSMHLAIC